MNLSLKQQAVLEVVKIVAKSAAAVVIMYILLSTDYNMVLGAIVLGLGSVYGLLLIYEMKLAQLETKDLANKTPQ
jgi:hypothetical protein